jgi:hypothetical protein
MGCVCLTKCFASPGADLRGRPLGSLARDREGGSKKTGRPGLINALSMAGGGEPSQSVLDREQWDMNESCDCREQMDCSSSVMLEANVAIEALRIRDCNIISLEGDMVVVGFASTIDSV